MLRVTDLNAPPHLVHLHHHELVQLASCPPPPGLAPPALPSKAQLDLALALLASPDQRVALDYDWLLQLLAAGGAQALEQVRDRQTGLPGSTRLQ